MKTQTKLQIRLLPNSSGWARFEKITSSSDYSLNFYFLAQPLFRPRE